MNHISDQGEVLLGLTLDLPLNLRLKDLELETNINNIKLDLGDNAQAEAIKDLTLHFVVENGFPFDSNLEMIFYGQDSDVAIDSIFIDQLFESALVDGTGRVTQSTRTRGQIPLTKANIDNLLDTERIQLKAVMNTFNGGNDAIKIYHDYSIDIQVGTEVNLDLNLTQ